MNKMIFGLALAGLSLTTFTPRAEAFSTTARDYSRWGINLILKDKAVLAALPTNESILSIEQVSRTPYQFDVKTDNCTLRVELDTSTPHLFIGNGLPHDPKIVDRSGCQQ